MFSDWITTVSPGYAREIRTPEFGCGLEGLLEHRSDRLTGILNGVDYEVWNPGRDPFIAHTYSARSLAGKRENKKALQTTFGLPLQAEVPVFGHVGRLVEQKGLDLILDLVPELLERPMQLVILGTGEPQLERSLRKIHRLHSDRIGVTVGYDEKLSHLIEAGSDSFLMPSRFEPCGLNQLYSLRYGTPPIVRNTGGLGDSVVDADDRRLADGTATGFVFDEADPGHLLKAIDRALALYARATEWEHLVHSGMRADFSWKRSAVAYLDLYQTVLDEHAAGANGPRESLAGGR